MAIVLAWTTFLAGGVYAWVWVPAAIVLAGLALVARPDIMSDRRVRLLDLTLTSVGLLLIAGSAITERRWKCK